MKDLSPKNHAEAVALFRSEIVGALTRRELDRGELLVASPRLLQAQCRTPRQMRLVNAFCGALAACL